MQVGLTRNDLLSLIALKADELSMKIGHGNMVASITNDEVNELVSRMSALAHSLFESPSTPEGISAEIAKPEAA